MSRWKSNDLKSKLLLQTDPNNPKYLCRRGVELFEEGKFREAGTVLERAVALDGKAASGAVWYSLGMCRHAIWELTWDNFVDDDGNGIDDRLEEVVGAFRRALAFPEMLAAPKVFFAVGKAYEDYGSFEGAMQMYSHVLSGFPSWENRSNVVLRAGAMCRHPRVNALDQAVQYFEFLLDNPPLPYTAAQVQFVLAGLYQRQGRGNLAMDMYADCLKKERDAGKRRLMKWKKDRANETMKNQAVLIDSDNKSTETEKALGVNRTKPELPPIVNIPKLHIWLKDPEVWRERARFHFSVGIFPLAVEDISQALRLAGVEAGGIRQQFRPRAKPEWEDWELLALSLSRITEKESALKALERAFRMNPYLEPVRLRARISRWDPEGWALYVERQNTSATRIQATMYRGPRGRKRGLASMRDERERRRKRNHSATSIQCAWRFHRFRINLKRQRNLINRSLARIARQKIISALQSWIHFVELRKYHRKRRERAAYSLQLWYTYQKARAKRKIRRTENRKKVSRALKDMRTRIKRAVVKAWEGYVVWIIDVKEPYNATWIQVWWRHLKWSAEFHRKRKLILRSLDNIRLNFTRRLFAHMRKVVAYTRIVRENRRYHRPRDRFRNCFNSWKWWTHEFVPGWAEEKANRKKERFYAVRREAFRLVDKNDLRIDPRNEFSVLGLASIGMAMGGGRGAVEKPASSSLSSSPLKDKSYGVDASTLDSDSNEAKLIRIARHPATARKLRRSLMMYDKVCQLWREYYANRSESVSTSFMHARLPKDTFDRASLGSYYYKGTVQTSLIKQELDRFRLTQVPLDVSLRHVMPGPQYRKPKTTIGTVSDADREKLEAHFVEMHRQAIAETKQRFGVPARLGIMALTLPNGLRKNVRNFDSPWPKRGVKALARLTGKLAPINPYNLKQPPKKERIIVDRDDRDEETEVSDNNEDDITNKFSDDDPAAILRKILRINEDVSMVTQDKYFGPPEPTTNRLVWGFPDFEAAGSYGVEGKRQKEEGRKANKQIAHAEWTRMAREEIEQREIDAKRLRLARESDYLRFQKAAIVGGPMDALDFFCAHRPGRMYEQRVYISACRIQLWALIMVPCRYNMRIHASINLQRAARGMLARRLFSTLKKVKYNVMRILARGRNSAFRQWYQYWHARRSAKHMAKRLLNRRLFLRFERWVDMVHMLHQARLEKVKHVMQKMMHAKLYRHFDAWAEYIPHMRKLQRLMWKVLASTKLFFFDIWAFNVEEILRERKELACAIDLQRVFRGWRGRRQFIRRFCKYDKIARVAQRIVRGHIGRVHTKLRRKRLRDAQVRAAKEKRIRELRGSYNDRVERERLRRDVEHMFVEDAVRATEIHLYDRSSTKRKRDMLRKKRNKTKFAAEMKVKKSVLKERRIVEKQLADAIKLFCRDNVLLMESMQRGLDTRFIKMKGSPPGDIPMKYFLETGKKLKKKSTRKFIAHRWTRAVGRSHAAIAALRRFRAERPPPCECEICLDTWAAREYTEHHHVCPQDQSHFIFSPASFYEFGLSEAGGLNVDKKRERIPVAPSIDQEMAEGNVIPDQKVTIAENNGSMAIRKRRMSSYM